MEASGPRPETRDLNLPADPEHLRPPQVSAPIPARAWPGEATPRACAAIGLGGGGWGSQEGQFPGQAALHSAS